MSYMTTGKGYILTTHFMKKTVQCTLVNTKGQYFCGHHLKAIGNIRKHDLFFGFTQMCQK